MSALRTILDASTILESTGWYVRQNAAHSRGHVDLAAQRDTVRLLVTVDPTEGELEYVSPTLFRHTPAIDNAFIALAAVSDDLERFNREVLADDLEDAAGTDITADEVHALHARKDVLHAIVITNQTLPSDTIRLEQSNVVTAGHQWIDVVRADAFPAFAESLTRHDR